MHSCLQVVSISKLPCHQGPIIVWTLLNIREGKERKNDRKIVKDVFITGDCCGQLTVSWGALLTVNRILEGCCGWIESTGEPLTLAPRIDWSHSETLTLPAIQLYPSLTIFPKDSRKVLQEQSIEFCLWMNTQDALW